MSLEVESNQMRVVSLEPLDPDDTVAIPKPHGQSTLQALTRGPIGELSDLLEGHPWTKIPNIAPQQGIASCGPGRPQALFEPDSIIARHFEDDTRNWLNLEIGPRPGLQAIGTPNDELTHTSQQGGSKLRMAPPL